MSAPIVQSEYDVLSDVARRFGQQNDQMKQMIQNLNRALEPLQEHGWLGDSASAFYDEMENEILRTCESLRVAFESAQEQTDKMSELIQNTEDQLANGFTFAEHIRS